MSSFADSLKSLYAMSSHGLQNEINGFLNCLKKKSFLLAEYTSVQQYRTENYSIRASATSPNPFRSESTHAASPVQSDCRITIPNLSATAMPSVSGVATYGGGLGGLIIKLWMNLTKQTLHAHAFDQKSIGFSFFGLTFK